MKRSNYARVKKVFQAVVELDRGEWGAFLDRECAGDAELRAEVDELLAAHREGTVLDLPQAPPPPRTRFANATAVGAQGRGGSEYRRGIRRHRGITIAIVAVTLSLFALGIVEMMEISKDHREKLQNVLQGYVSMNGALLELWATSREQNLAWVHSEEVRRSVDELLAALEETEDLDSPALTEPRAELRRVLSSFTKVQGTGDYIVISNRGTLVATSRDQEFLLGRRRSAAAADFFERCARDGPQVEPPFPLDALLHEWPAEHHAPAVVGYAVPVYAHDIDLSKLDRSATDPTALLLITEPVTDQFWKLEDTLVLGKTAEVYAFDTRGRMLSESRFESEPAVQALLPEGAKRTALNLFLHDPQRDLTERAPQAGETFETSPLVRTVRAAIATSGRGSNSYGTDIDGYRSYRGVMSVGSWIWIDRLDIGVLVEVDRDQVMSGPRGMMKIAGLFLLLLIFLGAGGLYSSVSAEKLSSRVEAGQELGQYTLVRKLGEGGLGQVFEARHARLSRPAAVKMIRQAALNEETVQRFEREVQLTSELTHPNTIVVYDYGRSETGTFYYAMEYLPGITLAELIARDAPLPIPRVIYILRQILGSLAEAHEAGLIHRDVKPLNVMLNHRGGEYDVVKVLDFGLAKEIHPGDLELTAEGMVSGTPLYIAPERLHEGEVADGRSDIYSLGTIAYQLITGRPPFEGQSRMEILLMVQTREAPRASAMEGIEVPAILDDLVWSSMAKDPADRPDGAGKMARVLEELQWQFPWNSEEAAAWWEAYRESGSSASGKEA